MNNYEKRHNRNKKILIGFVAITMLLSMVAPLVMALNEVK